MAFCFTLLCAILPTVTSIECGQTIIDALPNGPGQVKEYNLTITKQIPYGVFDTCKAATSFNPLLTLYDANHHTLDSVHYSDSCTAYPYNRPMLYYNISSYNLSTDSDLFYLEVFASNSYESYTFELSWQCADQTLSPTPSPTTAPPTESPTTAAPTTSPTYAPLPSYNSSLNHFIGVNEYKNWTEAMRYCYHQYDAPLAIIHSDSQNRKAAFSCSELHDDGNEKQCWIGLQSRSITNGTATWIDGSVSQWTMWNDANDAPYIALSYHDGIWDGLSTEKRPFICGITNDTLPVRPGHNKDDGVDVGSLIGQVIFGAIVLCCVCYCLVMRLGPRVRRGEHARQFLRLSDDAEAVDNPKRTRGMGWINACGNEPHIKTWLLTLILWFLIAIRVVCTHFTDELCSCACGSWSNYWDIYGPQSCELSDCVDGDASDTALSCSTPCDFAYAHAGWWKVVFVITIIVYLMECWFSNSRKYLSQSMIKESAYQYVERIRNTAPDIWWKVECYHMEPVYEAIRDGYGNEIGRRKVKEQRVTTWNARQSYKYGSWSDVSKQLTGLEQYKLTKLTFSKDYCFANNAASKRFYRARDTFKRNNDQDTFQDFTEGMDVNGYNSKLLAEVQDGSTPCFLNLFWFWIASVCLLSPIYRMWFSSVVGDIQPTIRCHVVG
eukprot:425994_1